MKITVKSLDQKSFQIDIEEDWTMLQIKEAIHKFKDEAPTLHSSVSKLIWKGKILKNEQVAKDCGIDEKGFFVVMPGKAVQSAPKSAAVEETPKVSSQKKKEEPKPASTNAPVITSTGTTACPNGALPIDPMTVLEQIPVSDDMISLVSGFGFTPEKSKLALQLTQGNPDAAAELLFSEGVDRAVEAFKQQMISMATQEMANLMRQNSGGATAAAGNPGNNTTTDSAITESEVSREIADSANPLAYLAEDQTFQQMLGLVRQNPGVLPQILQQIRADNPDLFSQIQNNHEAFLRLINLDSEGSNSGSNQNSTRSPAAAAAPAPAQQGNHIEIPITASDREAINRVSIFVFFCDEYLGTQYLSFELI